MEGIPLLGHELLVRGDNMLSALERAVNELTRRVGATDDLDDDRDLRIVEDGVRVRRDGHVSGLARLARVAHRGGYELQRPARGGVDAARALGERASDRRAHRPEAEQTDADRPIAHGRFGRPQTTPATGTTTRSIPRRSNRARTSVAKASVRSPSVTRESVLVLWSARTKSSTVCAEEITDVRWNPSRSKRPRRWSSPKRSTKSGGAFRRVEPSVI